MRFSVIPKKKIKISSHPKREKNAPSSVPFNFSYTNKESNLNTQNTFENFIQTPHNIFALNAAQAVVNSPGGKNNPLFLYGNVGLGKTHLIQAIGNALIEKNNNINVLYVTAEQFRDEYLSSINKGAEEIYRFKKRYASRDVLILDDIQFLAIHKGPSTKEQIHHIFNTLSNNNRQIIFSSDLHPRDLKRSKGDSGDSGFRSSLISRFDNGFTIEISPLDYESKLILLEKIAGREKVSINPLVKEQILNYCESDIRSIESKIRLISLYQNTYNKEMSINEFSKKNISKGN